MALDKFPVDESALPRVTISAKRLNEWKEVAQDEINRALSNRHSWYNAFKDKIRDGYDMIADKPNLKAFIRPVPNSNDKDILIRSTFDNTTLDDIAYGVYVESSYELRCAFAHMYEENFLDAGILHAHETRTAEDPMHFVGLRWIAFRSPAPAIVTSRDFIFFSYEGSMLDMNGQRVIFRFLRTMPMDDIHVDSSNLPPLVRGKISNLHFYRQNGTHVEAYVKAMHSNAGSMPSYVVTKTIAFMYPGVTNMETIGDARALMRQGMTRLNPSRASAQSSSSSFSSSSSGTMSMSSARPPASIASANACGVCYHKFKMTRSKRTCHGCSRTVCKRCTRGMWFFDEQKQMSSTGVVRLRFCLNCTRHARSEASATRSPLEPAMSTNRSDTAQALDMSSLGVSKGLHRVSSQDSLSRTPSQGSHHSSFSRTPSQDSIHSSSRGPSLDGLNASLHRVPSQGSMHSLTRAPSQNNMTRLPSLDDSLPSKKSLSQSTLSFKQSQPETEFSDDEVYDDELVEFQDNTFVPASAIQTPPQKAFASSKTMSFKSSSSSSSGAEPGFGSSKVGSVFNSSQVKNTFDSSQIKPAFDSSQIKPAFDSPVRTTAFDSSQVKIAFEGSPVANPFESSHVGQYSGFQVKHVDGDSEEERDDDEEVDDDFGDLHDSDSEDEELVEYSVHEPNYQPATRTYDADADDEPDIIDVEIDFDRLTDVGNLVDHHGLAYADQFSEIGDSDDYSIAGSFSYDFNPSFIGGEYTFDDDPDNNGDGSRGSFVPLTLDDSKPSMVAQYATGNGSRPPVSAPVPQLSQRRVPPQAQAQPQPQKPLTLRTYAPPTALPPTLDETTEFDGSSVPPPQAALHQMTPLRNSARTGSAPNLLAYGATKRTNRPGGVGMAPVRRAISGSGGGVIIDAGSAKGMDVSELSNGVNVRVNLYDNAEPVGKQPRGGQSPGTTGGITSNGGGSSSPMIRYYGS